jgi:hypothetical protein
MEPEEAKKLMCPFQNHPEKRINCIAEKCMAWSKDYGKEDGCCELVHGISGWISQVANRMPRC